MLKLSSSFAVVSSRQLPFYMFIPCRETFRTFAPPTSKAPLSTAAQQPAYMRRHCHGIFKAICLTNSGSARVTEVPWLAAKRDAACGIRQLLRLLMHQGRTLFVSSRTYGFILKASFLLLVLLCRNPIDGYGCGQEYTTLLRLIT